MSKIIDYVISISDNAQTFLSFKTKFVYNQYEENETEEKDDNIEVKYDINQKKKRFIRITLNRESFLNENDLITINNSNHSDILALANADRIDLNNIRFFNKIDFLSPKRNSQSINIREEDRIRNFSYYEKYQTASGENNSRAISYLRDDNDLNIKDQFLNGLFIEEKTFQDMSVINDINYYLVARPNEEDSINNLKGGDLFSNVEVLSSKINTLDYNQYQENNAAKCGLLIEKFEKINNKYNFLTAKFILTSKERKLKKVIEDESIAYGKTYRYVLSYVYLYTTVATNNRFILNKFLVCGHPAISSDIVCKEFVSPPPPNGLQFIYDDKQKYLKINWEEPKDYQDDAKGYQILKRKSIKEPFQVISYLLGHNSNDLFEPEEEIDFAITRNTPGEIKYSYNDYEFKPGEVTIYSIRTIDAHGLFSDYSSQIAMTWDPFERKLVIDQVSPSGAKRDKPNSLARSKTLFFDHELNIVENLTFLKNVDKISLYLTPDYVQIKNGDNSIPVLENNSSYKFTVFKINDLTKFEKTFKVTNFILNQD